MLGWELPPHNSGGLGVACFQLCKSLAKNNVDIEFVLPYKTDQQNDFMKIHSTTPMNYTKLKHHLNVYDGANYLSTHAVTSEQLNYENYVASKAQENEYDIIHAHDWLTFRAAMKAKQATNLPLIVHVHSIESDRSGGESGNPMIRDIERLGLMMADKVIAVSQMTKESIAREYDIPLDKISVVHNSLDIDELDELDNDNVYEYIELLKSNGYKVVTNVGRLTIQKNITGLLYAAKDVVDILPKTLFLIVGDGDQYHELISLSAELGILQNVIFAGFQRGKKWRDAFGIADLFVMPSVSEPFGITPLEAINYGTPSLISYQSGVSEIYKNCLKVDFWDKDEMVNKIVGFLRNEGLAKTMRQMATEEIMSMTWDKSAKATIKEYSKHKKVLA
ncbi:MAG: glycosyltransferase family 4 protein [bacterium]|jgi:glycosyltransferase involved in cell wall biosynthesis